MAANFSYTLSFGTQNSPLYSTDFLGLIDRIMGLIGRCDTMIAQALGYELGFHSMLASMESQAFIFQVDMEVQHPEQLILGDSMTQKELSLWFSRSHENLFQHITEPREGASWHQIWQQLSLEFHCQENLLFRPLPQDELFELRQELQSLLSQPQGFMEISMKKQP